MSRERSQGNGSEGRPHPRGWLPAVLAIIVALALGGTAVRYGTWAVGGSDSSCYALTAAAFSSGRLQPGSVLAGETPWPDSAATLAPAGFFASPVDPRSASPVCAPGFSLLIAPLLWIAGRDGVFLATPIACVALVWSAFVLGRRLQGAWTGLAAAVLVATSPIVLFQAMQPMNDIATAALWVAVVAVLGDHADWRLLTAGLLSGLALLVRPNLLPVAIVVLLWIIVAGRRPGLRNGLRAGAWFALGTVPLGLLVLWLNSVLYGSPFRSGYGDVETMFAWASIPLNARQYTSTLIDTHTVFPLVGLALPLVRGPASDRRHLAWLALAVVAAVVACYLPYRSFPEWWYLRFLLPVVSLLLVLAACGLVGAIDILTPGVGRVVALAVLAGVTVHQVNQARARQAFVLHELEGRFRQTAMAVRDHLPQTRMVIASWESGSLRFHADLEAVTWDPLAPDWLDRAVEWLTLRSGEPAIVVEQFEEPGFRQRFAGQNYGALDWPPRLEIDSMVRVYVPSDRGRYLAGTPVATQIIALRRR